MTVSAVCKFKPRPPALVDKMKTLISESFALKCWTWVARSSVFVPPSRRRYAQPIIFKKSSMISMTFVIWKKMRTCTKSTSFHCESGVVATHSVACSEELGKNACQKLDLTRRSNKFIVYHTARVNLILDALEQEWMLADLPKLHQLVTQALDTSTFPNNKKER